MKLKLIILTLFFQQLLFAEVGVTHSSFLTPHSTISYEVVDLKSGEVVAAQNPELCATPASVTK